MVTSLDFPPTQGISEGFSVQSVDGVARESMLNDHGMFDVVAVLSNLRPRRIAIAGDLTFEQTLEAFSDHVFSRFFFASLGVFRRLFFLLIGIFIAQRRIF